MDGRRPVNAADEQAVGGWGRGCPPFTLLPRRRFLNLFPLSCGCGHGGGGRAQKKDASSATEASRPIRGRGRVKIESLHLGSFNSKR